jgi:hypothetical protein
MEIRILFDLLATAFVVGEGLRIRNNACQRECSFSVWSIRFDNAGEECCFEESYTRWCFCCA